MSLEPVSQNNKIATIDSINIEIQSTENSNLAQNANILIQSPKMLGVTFKTFYSKSLLIKSVNRNYHMFKYFDKEKMKEKNSEMVYLSFEKIFSVTKSYELLLTKKQLQHQNLNLSLLTIKNRLISNKTSIENDLKNNKISDFFNFENNLAKCQELLDETVALTTRLNEPEFDFSSEDRINLGKIFPSNVDAVPFDFNSEKIDDVDKMIKEKQNQWDELKQKQLKLETEIKYFEARIKPIQEAIQNNFQMKHNINTDIMKLDEAKRGNDAHKKEVLDDVLDPKKLKDFVAENIKTKEKFDQEFANSLLISQQLDTANLAEIQNLQSITKRFHHIYILDKSGSMSHYFGKVIECINNVLEKRRGLPIADDLVSVIKFNSTAEIEYMNESIREDIKIKNETDGGTSFVKPLEKLNEILKEVNFDVVTPIVFFLSDGFGEAKNIVLKKCEEIKARLASTMNMIFFSVGFGQADSDCLEKMASTFNGASNLRVGDEFCKLYHHADNQYELTKVFGLFQKLFDHQKRLIENKRDLTRQLLAEKSNAYQQNSMLLESMDKKAKEFRESQIQFSLNKTLSYDEINKQFDLNIDKLKNSVKEIEKVMIELEGEVKKLEDEKSNYS